MTRPPNTKSPMRYRPRRDLKWYEISNGHVQVTNHGITSATGATSIWAGFPDPRIPTRCTRLFEEPSGEARPMERTARRPCVPGTSHIRACGVAPSAKVIPWLAANITTN